MRSKRVTGIALAISRENARERWLACRESDEVLVKIYRRDVHVVPVPCHDRPLTGLPPLFQGYGAISRATLRRIVHLISNGPKIWKSLLTVTYHKRWPTCGPCIKRHLNALRTALVDKYGKHRWFWVVEYQERGAPHFHILLDFEPAGKHLALSRGRRSWRKPMQWVGQKWQDSVHEFASTKGVQVGCRWEALDTPEAAGAYMGAYAGKMSQKTVPAGYLPPGAWWGRSQGMGDPEPEHVMRMPRTMWREAMGPEVTSSRGTDFRVVHDGRRKVLEAAERLDSITEGRPPGPDIPEGAENLPLGP